MLAISRLPKPTMTVLANYVHIWLISPTSCTYHWEDGKWKNVAGIRTRDHMRVFLARRARPLCYSRCPAQWHCWKSRAVWPQGKFSKCQKIDPLWDFSNKTLPSANKSLEEERKKEKSSSLSHFFVSFTDFFSLWDPKNWFVRKSWSDVLSTKDFFSHRHKTAPMMRMWGRCSTAPLAKKFLVLPNKVDSSQI